MSVYKNSELEKEIGFVGAQNELQRLTDRHLQHGGKVVRDIKFNASGKRYIERIKLSWPLVAWMNIKPLPANVANHLWP